MTLNLRKIRVGVGSLTERGSMAQTMCPKLSRLRNPPHHCDRQLKAAQDVDRQLPEFDFGLAPPDGTFKEDGQID